MPAFHVDEGLRKLIPPLSEAEQQQLEANLKRDGCHDPLIIWNEKDVLLDGHHRFEICSRLKLPYKTERLSLADRKAAQAWVIQNQFGRRNLTPMVRGELILKLEPLLASSAKERQRSGGKRKVPQNSAEAGETREKLAKAAGISHDTLQKIKVITETAPEPLKDKLRAGETTINAVYSNIKRQEKQAERTERETAAIKQMPKRRCKLLCGDFGDIIPTLKPNSVDAIITDPPYPKEFLSLYGKLAELAPLVLKPGGSLVVMIGQSYLPEILTLMTPHMRYQWAVAYLTPGGQSVQLWQRKVNTFWKPVLWFVNGKYEGEWIGDVAKSAPNDNDKRFHEWEQSATGMADLVERFTQIGDVILDPFMGPGSTGMAALALDRQFIGIDIDQSAVDTTTKRLM